MTRKRFILAITLNQPETETDEQTVVNIWKLMHRQFEEYEVFDKDAVVELYQPPNGEFCAITEVDPSQGDLITT